MEELLKRLIEAEVLTEETKKELEEAFESQLDEAIKQAREEEAANVRAELTEQWVQEKEALIEAIDSKVTDFVSSEMEELKEDIERFRDLEAEYAQKLVEAKAAMAEDVKEDLVELVEKLDAFLEMRLKAELEELREDIETVRRNQFGRKIVEAFAEEYARYFADEGSALDTVDELEARLRETEEALEEAEQEREALRRSIKMEEVLAPLSGTQREVMETILRNVDTDALEEAYNTFIGRVLRETQEQPSNSEKEDKVLAESEDEETDETVVTEDVTVVSGDSDEIVNENQKVNEDVIARYRRLAGLN